MNESTEELLEEVIRKDGNEKPPAPSGKAQSRRARPWLITGGTVIGAGLLAGLAFFIHSAFTYESTDNAFIDGHIVPVSAQVEGKVTRVLVEDNQVVKKGELLLEIDPADYQIKRDQARADLLSAGILARRTSADLARYEKLAQVNEISQQQLDSARADAESARALALRQQAALQKAELDLSRTRLTATEEGRVTKKSVEAGAFVRVGQPLLAIVPVRVWVTANFKETQLDRMAPGQPVTLKVDAFPGRRFEGHVDSLQSGTGAAFSILPPENATGNYVKVVQRVPVKIVIDRGDDDHRLVPGMSVVPSVKIR
jgi:membrane fusion protein (multidrug efflux system)